MAESKTAPTSPKGGERTPRNSPGRVIQFPGAQSSPQVQPPQHDQQMQYLAALERAAQLQEAASESVRQARRLFDHREIITRTVPLPAAEGALEDAILKAERAILSLKDDWDEAGASGYRVETWHRAVKFLRTNVAEATRLHMEFPIPRILPGPAGSIDLHWRLSHFEILVNIPPEATEPVRFFGDNEAKSQVKGTIADDGSESARLLPWLIKP